ncbi:MAG: DUF484 family protein [Pseudomonadota bacterium]|nr:DUF484 family protein [Pseudomonadota bacterium]
MEQDLSKTKNTPKITAADVVEYLRNEPNFFSRHPEALTAISSPDSGQGDGVINFQSVVINKLRDSAEEFKQERKDLLLTARTNQQSLSRIHECVLAVLASKSFEQVIHTVTTDFAVMLDLDMVVLCIEADDEKIRLLDTRGLVVLPKGEIERYLGAEKLVRLRGDITGEKQIFGAGASLIRSEAIVRLNISSVTPPSLIAFGSRDPLRFDSGQSTELVAFLACVLEHVISTWLDIPK